jgi:ParB family chromosome partitioning protein
MGKAALDASRINAFSIDPDTLIIIGHDTNDGPEHPLYDERAHRAVAENLVLNMMVHGWTHGAIEVRKDGSAVEVLVGRQRVKAARVANERLRAEGKEPVFVRAFVRGLDGIQAFGIMISENENRADDTPWVRFEKCQRYLAMGRSEADAAIVFGVQAQSIKKWMRAADLSADVQDAIRSGRVSFSAALELADLSREEQIAALSSLPEGEAPAKAVRKARSQASGEEETVRPGIRKIKRVLEANGEEEFLSEDFAKALRWVLGELSDRAIKGLSGVE